MKAKPRLVKETCIAGRVIDRTIRVTHGVVGGKKRAEKTNPTPESVKKNNDRIAVLNLTRKINATCQKMPGFKGVCCHKFEWFC